MTVPVYALIGLGAAIGSAYCAQQSGASRGKIVRDFFLGLLLWPVMVGLYAAIKIGQDDSW